jgi:sensor histidine kinase regulating citrate/malate metabolism
MPEMPFGFNFIFTIFPIIFIVMFLFSICMFVFVFSNIFKQMKKDNNSPRIRVQAKVIAKRENIRRSSSMNDHHSSSINTTYYATFEVESGDRMELHMAGQEYGLLVEGDEGILTFQGSRFVSFERSASGYAAASSYSSNHSAPEEYPFDRR